MFFFYHSKQKESNESFYKGLLFESLLKQFLDVAGYDVVLRQKHNSLEYDIEGEDRTTKFKVVGEAKAHTASIPGLVFTSFVGKLLPLGLINKEIKGLFLSTASLTPEATEYYRKIKDLGVITYTGEDLENKIKTTLKLPDYEPLAKQLREQGYTPQQDHILTTEHSIFTVITAGSAAAAAPAHFAVFQDNGQIISDRKFLNQLAENVSELKSLKPIISEVYQPNEIERTIRQGLVVGNTWTDYRFPAPPQFYVGRQEFIERILNYCKSDVTPNIIQIKSRSGVGKSSTLAFLENALIREGFETELHDARDIRSVLDIYSIIQRFTKSSSSPKDFKAVEFQLEEFSKNLENSRGVIMVDQFESTFVIPEVFQAYETLAMLLVQHAPKLWICFARKNDQITTYDDSKVSLEKLNGLAKSFELKDFTQKEAAELLDKANSAALKPVGKNILGYVLEFAQGFPWLVKRTIAHITGLSEKGGRQGELFASVLKLDDLFDEELEGLDEIEREYLTRIAARLPADFNQLLNLFDEDPLLPKILDKLTQSRLLRLSGSTYDTYNDVFKEYLVYRKLPEFKQSVIYRNAPNQTLKSFHWAVNKEEFTIEEIKKEFNISKGSAFNRIRELTALNLIRRDNNIWKVPRTVIDIFNQGRLGEYLRGQLVDNIVVSNLINRVAQNDKINIKDVPDYLESQFPFIDASPNTWKMYSGTFVSWLTATKLVDILDDTFVIPKEERKFIVESLGNLSIVKPRSGGGSKNFGTRLNLFLPSCPWQKLEANVEKLLNNENIPEQDLRKISTDLRRNNLISDGKLKVESLGEFKKRIKEILTSAPYETLWEAINTNESLLPIFQKIVESDYSEETLKWRLKTLLGWAKGVGIIENKRHQWK
jgi:hypothetical protein